jgi:cupin 2 domain-containing protein
MGGAPVWAGVDVGGRSKAFHLAFLDEELRVSLGRAASVGECVQVLLGSGTSVVAIDAPSAWALPGERSRPCERWFAGMRLCNIRFTPDGPTATAREDGYYEWVEHGLELWAACRAAGIVAVECFPTASWSAWIGPRGTQSRADWTKRGAAELARAGLRGGNAARNQDERDAIAAALTAHQLDRQSATVETFDDLVVPRRGTWPLGAPPIGARVGRGRLERGGGPTVGERTIPLAGGRGFVVEQILSGRLRSPVEYLQDHDEWAVVLDGSAVLEIDGIEHALASGDWVLLPARVAHRLVSTEPGTDWLVVRGDPVRPPSGGQGLA